MKISWVLLGNDEKFGDKSFDFLVRKVNGSSRVELRLGMGEGPQFWDRIRHHIASLVRWRRLSFERPRQLALQVIP